MKKFLFTLLLFLFPVVLFAHSYQGYQYSKYMLIITIPFVYYLLDRKMLYLAFSYTGRLSIIIANFILFFISVLLQHLETLHYMNFFLSFFFFVLIFKTLFYSMILKLKSNKIIKMSIRMLIVTLIGLFIEIIISVTSYLLLQ